MILTSKLFSFFALLALISDKIKGDYAPTCAPSNLQLVENSVERVEVSWKALPKECLVEETTLSGYKIKACESSDQTQCLYNTETSETNLQLNPKQYNFDCRKSYAFLIAAYSQSTWTGNIKHGGPLANLLFKPSCDDAAPMNPPQDLKVLQNEKASIKLSWTPPSSLDLKNPVVGYQIKACKEDTKCPFTDETTETQYEIKIQNGLEFQANYTILVSAFSEKSGTKSYGPAARYQLTTANTGFRALQASASFILICALLSRKVLNW